MLIVLCSQLFSQSKNESNIFYSLENRLKFGNYLFCQEDYLRANDEYAAYLEKSDNDTIQFKIGIGLARMKYFADSRASYKKLFNSQTLSDEAKFFYLYTYYVVNKYDEFEKTANSILPNNYKYRVNYQKQQALAHLLVGYNFSEEDIVSPFEGQYKSVVSDFYQRAKNPKYKSPVLAGVMSAIIPGSGKAYAGMVGDGITSFLLTGLFTFLAIDNFNKEHDTKAWIFTGVAAFFYTGNIYGSVAAAQIYNAGVRFNFESDIKIFLGKTNYFIPTTDYLCD